MKKVVFICRGNVIRSQICKAFYNKLSADGSFADSFGTGALKDGNEGIEIGSIKYLSGLVKAMQRYGLDISHEKPKQLKEDSIKDANKIIFMGLPERIPEWMNKYNYEYWEDCLNGPEINKKFNINSESSFGDAEDIEDTINFLETKVKNLIKTNPR
ncbi:MAG: low molecular weight phosphatase family protein [Candidatus Paceibacterota bacterium]|jgi:protein-tyrosine-phosphatase